MKRLALLCCAFVAIAGGCAKHTEETVRNVQEVAVESRDVAFYPELTDYVADTLSEFHQISDERMSKLRELADFVTQRSSSGQASELVFICTHNSRRSHLSQIWAQAAAHYFDVDGVVTYSGGTEATAFNPRAVAAIKRAGFTIETMAEGDNPVYGVKYLDEMEPMQCFSKVYDQPPNPKQGFAAVMTCSAADEACPIVFGAAERIAIPFDDPKAFDGTDQEAAKYDERCRQIARELLYVFSQVDLG